MKLFSLALILTVSAFGQVVTGGSDATGRMNLGAQPFTVSLPNSATGTTLNKLAKAVVAGGVLQAQIITTSAADQAAVIGCVVSGAGVTGSALIVVVGTASCYFDAATTAGHIAVPSSTSAGALHDSGSSSSPATGEVLATVGATNACSSPPCLIAGNVFMTPDLVAQGANGNGGGGGGGGNKNSNIRSIGASFGSFESGGTALSGSKTSCVTVHFAGVIQKATITGEPSGSVTVDVLKVAHASWTGIGSVASITAAAVPALSSAATFTDSTLSGWTTAIAAETDVCFALTSPTTVAGVAISLQVKAN